MLLSKLQLSNCCGDGDLGRQSLCLETTIAPNPSSLGELTSRLSSPNCSSKVIVVMEIPFYCQIQYFYIVGNRISLLFGGHHSVIFALNHLILVPIKTRLFDFQPPIKISFILILI